MGEEKINQDIADLYHNKMELMDEMQDKLMDHVWITDVHIKPSDIVVKLRSNYGHILMSTLETIRDFLGIDIEYVGCEEKREYVGCEEEDVKEYEVVFKTTKIHLEDSEKE